MRESLDITSNKNTVIHVGSRKSQLALNQTEYVVALLSKLNPNLKFNIHGMTTTGDDVQDKSLSKIGSKSLFTKELESALYDNRVDLVVHSLKDMPTTLPDGMILGALLKRVDPRDSVVISKNSLANSLEELPDGSVIGTSSVRRIAQLKRHYPLLQFKDIRGNLNTRLSKLDALDSEYSALILAHAGLHRLGWTNRISQVLDTPIMYYAVGQGALAVECRQDDTRILKLLEPLKDYTTTITCSAERALMKRLEGGCSVPLGVSTKFDGRTLELSCIVCSLDGKIEIIESMNANVCSESEQDQKKDQSYESAMLLGVALADKMIQLGAKTLLDKIRIENNQTLK